MADDVAIRWKALNPQERDMAMARMSADQKMKLATALGYKAPAPPPANNAVSASVGDIKPASPPTSTSWLNDMESDLRGGGSRTVAGKILGMLQGTGSKGYSGLESGTSKSVADTMGSIPLGAVKFMQGVAETPEHPLKGAVKAAGGVMQMGTLPSMFSAAPAAEGAMEAIPSKDRAAQLFESVAKDANQIPVKLSRSGDEALKALDIARASGRTPGPLNSFLERVTKAVRTPGSSERTPMKPFSYEEARRYYTALTRLSADEAQKIAPPLKAQLGQLANALKQDIGDAAAEVGRAGDYYSALRDYAKASRLARTAQWMLKYIAAPAGGTMIGKMALDRFLPRGAQ